MNTVTITLDLPDEIAEQAKAAGLLEAEKVIELLEKELQRQASVNRLFETAEKFRAVQPPLTLEEIEEEIRLAREESNPKRSN